MRLTMSDRGVLIKAFTPRYQRSRKNKKGALFDEFTKVTGYNRSYAAYWLRRHGKRIRLRGKVVGIADATQKLLQERPRKYGRQVVKVFKKMWALLDYMWGTRLAAILPEVVAILEKEEVLQATMCKRWM